jgi:hypothetical protein
VRGGGAKTGIELTPGLRCALIARRFGPLPLRLVGGGRCLVSRSPRPQGGPHGVCAPLVPAKP